MCDRRSVRCVGSREGLCGVVGMEGGMARVVGRGVPGGEEEVGVGGEGGEAIIERDGRREDNGRGVESLVG